jgi:hypothetical protein
MNYHDTPWGLFNDQPLSNPAVSVARRCQHAGGTDGRQLGNDRAPGIIHGKKGLGYEPGEFASSSRGRSLPSLFHSVDNLKPRVATGLQLFRLALGEAHACLLDATDVPTGLGSTAMLMGRFGAVPCSSFHARIQTHAWAYCQGPWRRYLPAHTFRSPR